MVLEGHERALLDGVAARADAIVERAVAWCAISSGSRNLDGLERQRTTLEQAFGVLPGRVEMMRLQPSAEVDAEGAPQLQPHPDAIRVTVRPEAPVQVALTGHYDTVYPAETRFREVVRRGDGALHGPGIADMKGGLSVMLAALEALEAHPEAANLGYQVLLSPDEEIGSPASAPLLAKLAGRAHVGLTYEPALGDGALASSRKGSGNFAVTVKGRAAHAGRDFAAGRNAVAAAARLAAALDALNRRREGVTVNVARIEGGGPLNMVPAVAVVRFNVRVLDAESGAWIEAAVDEVISSVAATEGIAFERHGGMTRAPKPVNAAQQQLFDRVREAAGLMGLDLQWKPSGGVCEGNNLFAAGLPNLDTLGVRGGDIHSENEHAWPDSFAERAQLSALILGKLASGEIDARGLKAAMV
jgi:glutamate carboxypeptidase